MVLYRPREEQRYYYGADQTEVYWVHFTVNNVKNFLRRYGIADDPRIIYTGISIEYKNLFMSNWLRGDADKLFHDSPDQPP